MTKNKRVKKSVEITYYVNNSKTTVYSDTETFTARDITDIRRSVEALERAFKRDQGRVMWLTTEEFEWGDAVYQYNGEGSWDKTVDERVSFERCLQRDAKRPGKLKRYHVAWTYSDVDGVVVRARNEAHAELLYRGRVTDHGRDKDLLACWPEVHDDITVTLV